MPDASFEEALRNCRDSAEIAELCKRSFAASGTVQRDADGFVSYTEQPVQQMPASVQPPVEDGLFREVWQLPNGNLQVVEAYSYHGLHTITSDLKKWGAVRVR